MSYQADEAIKQARIRLHKDLKEEITLIMQSSKPAMDMLGYYRQDWTRFDEAAKLVRTAMGSDYLHSQAVSIVHELIGAYR